MNTYKDLKKQISKFNEVEFYRFLDDIFNSKRLDKDFNLLNNKLNNSLSLHRQEVNNIAHDVRLSKYKTKLFELKLEYLDMCKQYDNYLCETDLKRSIIINYDDDKKKYWHICEQQYLNNIRKLNVPIIKKSKYKIGDVLIIRNGYEKYEYVYKHKSFYPFNAELELTIKSIEVDENGILYYNTTEVNTLEPIIELYEYHISDPSSKIIRKTNIKNILK